MKLRMLLRLMSRILVVIKIIMKTKRGFTLIELLVVVAIIALLMAILMPALRRARLQAMSVVCQNRMKNILTGWFTYTVDNNGQMVGSDYNRFGQSQGNWVSTPISATGLNKRLGNTVDD